MKTIAHLACMLLFTTSASLLFTSCDGNEQYAVTAQVGNFDWKSDGYVIAYSNDSALLVNAISNTYFPLVFYFKDMQVGSYALDSARNQILYGNSVASGFITSAHNPGELTITSYSESGGSGRIAGTFSGYVYRTNGSDSLRIQNGLFDLNFD